MPAFGAAALIPTTFVYRDTASVATDSWPLFDGFIHL